jgi:L-threonylcarbamoyladenylate synthase
MSDGLRTVAVRVPDNAMARAIIAATGGALAVTSANRSGETPAVEACEVPELGFSQPVLVIAGGRAPGGVPSTIVRVTGEQLKILREGAISASAIAAALASSEANPVEHVWAQYDLRMTERERNRLPEATR